MNSGNIQNQYLYFRKNKWTITSGEVVVEAPVTLSVNGEIWLTFMCTPVDLEAMAIGFLFNENLIKSFNEIASIDLCSSKENVDVWSYHEIIKPKQWQRTSGCTGGITSVKSDISVKEDFDLPSISGSHLFPGQVTKLIDLLYKSQDLYSISGGIHTSGLSDGKEMYIVSEDIGRHNTLDKIAGKLLLEKIEIPRHIIVTTGRISSEMIQKSARIGADTVISRTSPSSLSIQLAQSWGITLIGYARRDQMTIYTHQDRIIVESISDFNS